MIVSGRSVTGIIVIVLTAKIQQIRKKDGKVIRCTNTEGRKTIVLVGTAGLNWGHLKFFLPDAVLLSQLGLSHPREDLNQPPGTSDATGITKVSTGRKNKVR